MFCEARSDTVTSTDLGSPTMVDKSAVIRATASRTTLSDFLNGKPSRNVVTLKNSQSVADALQV